MLPPGVTVPSGLIGETFVAMPLTRQLAALDHAAYVASPDVIAVHSAGRWPVDGFTLEHSLPLVALHEADHAARRAFTFVLLDPTRSRALGCLYLNPLEEFLRRVGARPARSATRGTAMVTFWIRQDEQGLVDELAAAIDTWLREEWPLDAHVFRVLPGEQAPRAALERLALRPVDLGLPAHELPYLWFAQAQ